MGDQMRTTLLHVLFMVLWTGSSFAADRPMNVLFIAIDDLNDWVGFLGGHPQTKTPHMDRLARQGMVFENAQCAAPICGPSRAAIMSGIAPDTSGVYANADGLRESPVLKDAVMLPRYFSNHGYTSMVRGKIFHGFDVEPRSWDILSKQWNNKLDIPEDQLTDMSPYRRMKIKNGLPYFKPSLSWEGTMEPKELTFDYQNAIWASRWLTNSAEQDTPRPFFLACGLFRPHLPWNVPAEHFARFDPDKIRLPPIKEDDLDDIEGMHGGGAKEFRDLVARGLHREAVWAYLANVAYADDCVGVVLDALEKSPYRDNTIVVLWGDHGWHLGEKLRTRKWTPWEEAARSPLVIKVPGLKPGRTARPVNLVDLYPTLVDLAGLPPKKGLSGRTLVPLIKNPQTEWDYPSVTTVGYGTFSIRSERWRYIIRKDGAHELYDHANDPQEWNNLINSPEYESVKAELRKALPKTSRAPGADLQRTALAKLNTLERMMREAEAQSIDVTREKTLVWFAGEFLKYADWDEANQPAVEKMFGLYWYWQDRKKRLARDLPDFERRKVNEMLDEGILTLQQVLDGKIRRRPAVRIDWANVAVDPDQFTSNGKPVFLYDYFSKPLETPRSDTNLYNDHLGNIDWPESVAAHCLKGDGSYDLPRLHLVTKHPDTRIGYTMLWHKEQPDWVYETGLEVLKGQSLFIGYDIDNPMMRERWSRLLRRVGTDTRGSRGNQLGYVLANEPHWFSRRGHWSHQHGEMQSLSRHTLAKFKRWLRKKHANDVGALSKLWNKDFATFDQVEIDFPLPASLRGKPAWYDWCRFNMDRGVEWLSSLQSALRAGNPDADTHVKVMPHLFSDDERDHGIDLEAVTELTSMIGNDAKTGGRYHSRKKADAWEARYAYRWRELCMSYDFMESVAPDKIHVNSESHFISMSQWKELDTSPAYVRSCYWLATLLGMDANLTWFWARDPDGSPEHRLETYTEFSDPALAGSYAGSVNMQPQTANEITQVMIDLNAFSEEIMRLRRQRKPVRLFHSETSAINKHHHMSEQFELYESLQFEGLPLGFATEKILRKQDRRAWDVVLVHRTPYVTDSEFNELQSYLDKGGVIIIDDRSLTLNEYGEKREHGLQAGSGKLIHLDASSGLAAFKNKALSCAAGSAPSVRLSEDNGSPHKGCIWRVAPKPDGGCLMTVLNLGKNRARLRTVFAAGGEAVCTDMLTGRLVGASFELEPTGVLLLEVAKQQEKRR